MAGRTAFCLRAQPVPLALEVVSLAALAACAQRRIDHAAGRFSLHRGAGRQPAIRLASSGGQADRETSARAMRASALKVRCRNTRGVVVERFTISLDDRLAEQFDEWMADRSYANRSEAVREVVASKSALNALFDVTLKTLEQLSKPKLERAACLCRSAFRSKPCPAQPRRTPRTPETAASRARETTAPR
jgi:hypothetical protein